jgi:LacI family transcriptional regulator
MGALLCLNAERKGIHVKANLTLEDIGRLAGVSRSTVSRVVNESGSVRPDVRQRVLDVIHKTGYTPNAAARSLVSGRTGLVGLVIPSRVHSLFADPYFGRLIQGISAGCNRSGVALTLFLLENESEEAALYPRVSNPGFLDGLILTATRMRDPLLARIAFGELPIVVVGRPDIEGVSYVDVDNEGGARMVASHLCELGYQRIGLIGAPTDTTAGLDRLTGFVEGLAACGVALDPALRVDGDFSEISGYRAMQHLVALRPEAVFAASDTMAMGALRALREAGTRVPDDVALIGFDGSAASENANPPLTTIRQDVHGTGDRAVKVLNRLIHGESAAPIVDIQPVELIVRASTAGRDIRHGQQAKGG